MHPLFDSRAFNDRLFFPLPDPGSTPDRAVDTFVDVPGARLHLRRHLREGILLLLFHGNGEIVADYDDVADTFADAGAALAIVDYRGYGRSDGVPTLRTVMTDARPVAEAFARDVGRPFVVMGRSLGSAAAAELYGEPLQGMIGLVWESGFVDTRGLAMRRNLSPSAEGAGIFDPIPKLRRGRLPMLVLHGAEDDLILAEEGRAAFDACGASDKRLTLVPRRGHNDVSLSPVYQEAMRAFFGGLGR